jgi:hypothetical protein
MPNDTVRADARPMPKPEPERAAAPSATDALLKHRFAFERAYTRWLTARAARENPDAPDDNESAEQRGEELTQAEREFILMPAIYDWMVWHKIEFPSRCMEDELRTGTRSDHFSLLALAAIKKDLLRLGIRNDGDIMAELDDPRRA